MCRGAGAGAAPERVNRVQNVDDALRRLASGRASCVVLAGAPAPATLVAVEAAARSAGVPLVVVPSDASALPLDITPQASTPLVPPPQPRDVLDRVRESLERIDAQVTALERHVDAAVDEVPSVPPSILELLSVRELEIVAHVEQGLTNKEVGARLFISPHTVGNHLRSIYRKLGVHSRTELVARMHAA